MKHSPVSGPDVITAPLEAHKRVRMKSAESCIGEPAAQWPRSNACIRRDECQAIAKVIWKLPAVVSWVFESTDAEERDCRACSLTTATTNALRNARQLWLTPQAHRNLCENLAERLDKAPREGKRLEKLRRDLERAGVMSGAYPTVAAPTHAGPTGLHPDKSHKLGRVATAIVRITEKAGLADSPTPIAHADADKAAPPYQPPLAELASLARMFAKAAVERKDDPNWTQPRPRFDRAARNIFIFEFDDFQRDNYGRASHAMTAEIVRALFPPDDDVDAAEVETLTRARRKRRSSRR